MLKYFYALLLLTVFGCTKKTKHNNIFIFNIESGITSLDPAFAKDQSNMWIVNQLFSGLLKMNNKLQVQPDIARKWEISKNGCVYKFTLKNNVYFHTSTLWPAGQRKVNSNDFVFSFLRLIDSATASPGAWILRGKLENNDYPNKSIYAVNDSELVIRLKAPFAPFLGLLTMCYCKVLAPEIVKLYGKDIRTHAIGTGPFELKWWRDQDAISLVKNTFFYEKDTKGEQLPYLDGVLATFNPDKLTAFLNFYQGNTHFMSGLDASFKDLVLDKKGLQQTKTLKSVKILKSPYLNTEYLAFQLDSTKAKYPYYVDYLRKALHFGINRTAMLRYLRNGIGNPNVVGLVPPVLLDTTYLKDPYNIDSARYYLKLIGNKRDQPINIQLFTNPSYVDICSYIQEQLMRIGIRLNIETLPGPTLRQMISKQEVPFFRASWIADYPDAENYLSLFYSKNFAPNGPNYTHYSSSNFDKLFEKAISQTTLTDKTTYYRKLDQLAMSLQPVIVLFYDEVFRLVNPKLAGMEPNPLNELDLRKVKFQN